MNIRGRNMGKLLPLGFCLFLLASILAFPQSAALAEDDEAAAVREEIEALKRALERLEERLMEIEKRPAAVPDSSPAAEEKVTQPPAAAPEPGPAATAEESPKPAVASDSEASSSEGLSRTQERAIRDRWKKIERGLTEQEVEALLGKPKNVTEIDNQIVWYYRYEGVGSTVVFDREGRVSGWQKPPFGLFW